MATYVLIHGAADSAWYWHLVEAELRERGHDVVAVDLPCDDDSAGWEDYACTVVAAIGERSDLVVVAHSLGGFTAPLVCARVPVDLLVLVAAMVPTPGETGAQWWANTDYEDDGGDAFEAFLHDVPADLAAEAMEHGRDQSATPMAQPWPLEAWPDVPTRFLLCRDDRFFKANFLRRVVQDRLEIVPDEIDGGHTPALSRPVELAERLETYWNELG